MAATIPEPINESPATADIKDTMGAPPVVAYAVVPESPTGPASGVHAFSSSLRSGSMNRSSLTPQQRAEVTEWAKLDYRTVKGCKTPEGR
jgi:hypothetical protein